MLIRHEPKSYCLPKASQSLHWITQLASSSAFEAYFVRLGSNASQAWGMEMELRHLRYFVAVAETESLSLAAKSKLHTSQTEMTLPPVVSENAAGTGAEPTAYVRERPGLSAFVHEDDVVYHTYST